MDYDKECVNFFFNSIVPQKLDKHGYVDQLDLFSACKVIPDSRRNELLQKYAKEHDDIMYYRNETGSGVIEYKKNKYYLCKWVSKCYKNVFLDGVLMSLDTSN